MTEFIDYYQAPYSLLKILCDADSLLSIEFVAQPSQTAKPSVLTERIKQQLRQYERDPSFRFDLPVRAQGTAYQQKVWQALTTIPAGQLRRYGELSQQLNSSARAVGSACRRNPTPVVVPCHRVVAASGLGGFAGATDGDMLAIKNWLLAHEGAL